jgi:hypothetical protein
MRPTGTCAARRFHDRRGGTRRPGHSRSARRFINEGFDDFFSQTEPIQQLLAIAEKYIYDEFLAGRRKASGAMLKGRIS